MTRVLWVSAETPDRNGQGGQRRQFHQIKALSARGHRVEVLSLAGPQDDTSLRGIAPVRRLRSSVAGRASRTLARRISAVVDAAPGDAVVVSHLDSLWMLPEQPRRRRPILVDVHNVMSDWLRRRGLDDEATEALAREDRAVGRVSAIATCSASERRRFVEAHPQAAGQTIVAPLGIDPAEWPDQEFSRRDPVVAMFGSWGWPPNAMGLDWFARQVWPLVRASLPQAVALVAGPGCADSGLPEGMRSVGRVPDLAAFTARASVVAVPVLLGVGASVKFAEALASGAAVVATSDGASAFARSPAFVSDDAQEWAGWTVERLRRRAEETAPHRCRAFALEHLTWQEAVEPLDGWLRRVAAS